MVVHPYRRPAERRRIRLQQQIDALERLQQQDHEAIQSALRKHEAAQGILGKLVVRR